MVQGQSWKKLRPEFGNSRIRVTWLVTWSTAHCNLSLGRLAGIQSIPDRTAAISCVVKQTTGTVFAPTTLVFERGFGETTCLQSTPSSATSRNPPRTNYWGISSRSHHLLDHLHLPRMENQPLSRRPRWLWYALWISRESLKELRLGRHSTR